MANGAFPGAGAVPLPNEATAREAFVQNRGQQASDLWDAAYKDISDLRAQDVVNLPEEPQPENNPFMNPLVMLGMSLQGKSAEAISASQQIKARNRARTDRYNEQVLQAYNYKQLRMNRYATTLAEIQAKAATSELAAETTARAELRQERQFERTQHLAEHREKRLDESADRMADVTAERDRLAAINKRDDRLAKDPAHIFYKDKFSALRMGRFPGVESYGINNDGNLAIYIEKAPPIEHMTHEERKTKLGELKAQLIEDATTFYGDFDDKLAREIARINARIDSDIEASDAQNRGEWAPGFEEVAKGPVTEGGEAPEGELTVAQRAERSLARTKFGTTEAVVEADIDVTTGKGALQIINQLSDSLEGEIALGVADVGARIADEGGAPTTSEAASLRAGTIQAYGKRLREGKEKRKDFLTKPEGKGLLLTLAREIGQEVFAGGDVERRDVFAIVKQRLMKEHGIAAGYAKMSSVKRAVIMGLPVARRGPGLGGTPIRPKGTKF